MALVVAERPKSQSTTDIETASEKWVSYVRQQVSRRIDPQVNTFLRKLVARARSLSDGAALVRLPEEVGKTLYNLVDYSYPMTTEGAAALAVHIGRHTLAYKVGIGAAISDIYMENPERDVGSFNGIMAGLERDSLSNAEELRDRLWSYNRALFKATSHFGVMRLAELLRSDLETQSETINEELMKAHGKRLAGT